MAEMVSRCAALNPIPAHLFQTLNVCVSVKKMLPQVKKDGKRKKNLHFKTKKPSLSELQVAASVGDTDKRVMWHYQKKKHYLTSYPLFFT